jgi:hypothetical protein
MYLANTGATHTSMSKSTGTLSATSRTLILTSVVLCSSSIFGVVDPKDKYDALQVEFDYDDYNLEIVGVDLFILYDQLMT